MTTAPVLDDPMLFAVWASVDPQSILQAAKHIVTEVPLPLARCYQLAKLAVADGSKVEIWTMRPYKEAMTLANELPAGFVVGTGVVTECITDPRVSPYCPVHACYYGRTCSICEGNFL